MLVQTMAASSTSRLHVVDESILESLARQVAELTNKIQELEQKTQEQEQRLQQLVTSAALQQRVEPKPKAIKVVKEPKPKEITLKELKVQAEELGVTDRDVKDQGSKTKKASWQKAIELKIAQRAAILLEDSPIQPKQEQEPEIMISCINPYSVDTLNALLLLNAVPTTETSVENYPF